MVCSVVEVVLLDGDVAVREPEQDPPRSSIAPAETGERPIRRTQEQRPRWEELAGLSRLTDEIERFAAWTAGVSRGSYGDAEPHSRGSQEAAPSAEPVARSVAADDPPAKPEPHRSGVFGWAFKRR